MTLAAGSQGSAGMFAFTVTNPALGTWAAGDVLVARIGYTNTNGHGSDKIAVIETGVAANDYISAPDTPDSATGSASLPVQAMSGSAIITAETAATGGAALPAAGLSGAATVTNPDPPAYRRHLINTGPEFGAADQQATYGFDNIIDDGYHYEQQLSLDYLAARGWTHIWLPIRWERIQPTLGAALNSTELGYITGYLDRCSTAGLKVAITLHNFGLYYTGGGTAGVNPATGTRTALTSANLVDVWQRIMNSAIGSHAALDGVSIMCEPQGTGGLTQATWRTASQNTVDAIRAINADIPIYVSGWDWSSLENWPATEGASGAWLTADPNVYYEAHHYWDAGGGGAYSGTYASYVTAAQTAGYTAGSYADALQNRVMTELGDWKAWLDSNGVNGIVGEIGWPGPGASTADQDSWNALGDLYLSQLDSWGISTGYWGAGEVYGNSPAEIICYASSGGYIATLDTTEPQDTVLEAHPSSPAGNAGSAALPAAGLAGTGSVSGGGGSGGISLVEEIGGHGTGSVTIDLGTAYAPGDLLVIITYNTPGASTTFTLDGNPITPTLDVANGGNQSQFAYSGATAGSTLVITGTAGYATFAVVSHFTGFGGTPTLDASHHATGTGTAISTGATGTLGHANEAVAGAAAWTAATTATGAGAPWTETPQQIQTYSEIGGAQATSDTASRSYDITAGASVSWKAIIVAYYDPSPPTGTTASGSAALPPAGLAGTAGQEIATAGALALPPPSPAATAGQEIDGTGGLNLLTPGLAGNGTQEHTASGALAAPAGGLGGSAAVAAAGSASGSLALRTAGLAGTIGQEEKITGAAGLAATAMSGTGTVIAAGSASGSLALPAAGLAGTAESFSCTGGVALPTAGMSGAAGQEEKTAGSLALAAAQLTGTGAALAAGSSAGSLGLAPMGLAGTVESFGGSGGLQLGAMRIAATGAIAGAVTATGGLGLPPLTAGGAGASSACAGGIALPIPGLAGAAESFACAGSIALPRPGTAGGTSQQVGSAGTLALPTPGIYASQAGPSRVAGTSCGGPQARWSASGPDAWVMFAAAPAGRWSALEEESLYTAGEPGGLWDAGEPARV